MTSLESKKLVAVLSALWPDARWPEETCEAYAAALADLDYALADRAVRMVCQVHKFRPTVAEVRAAVVRQMVGPKRSAVDAWAEVRKAIREVGRLYGPDDEPPKFRDRVLAFVVQRMGWNHLCDVDAPDGVIEKRFADFYDSVQNNAELLLQLSEDAKPKLTAGSVALKRLVAGIGLGGKEPEQ